MMSRLMSALVEIQCGGQLAQGFDERRMTTERGPKVFPPVLPVIPALYCKCKCICKCICKCYM